MSLIQSPLPWRLVRWIKFGKCSDWAMMTVPAMHRGRCDEFSEDHITEMVVLRQVSKLGQNPQPIKKPQIIED